VHIYIYPPKILPWNFLQIYSYLYEVVRTTFPQIFGLFAIFDRNFAKIVAPPSDKCSAPERGISYEKNAENLIEIGQ